MPDNAYLQYSVNELNTAIQQFQNGWRDVRTVTATADNMLNGITAMTIKGTVTGNIQTIDTTYNSESVTNNPDNEKINVQIPSNAYYTTSANLAVDYSAIANSIGLDSNQIVEGNTILGVPGTAQLSTGTVTSISIGNGLSGDNNPITESGTISHAAGTSGTKNVTETNVLLSGITADTFGHIDNVSYITTTSLVESISNLIASAISTATVTSIFNQIVT